MVEVVPLVDSGLGKGVTAIAAELAIRVPLAVARRSLPWALTVWALGVGEGGIGQGVDPDGLAPVPSPSGGKRHVPCRSRGQVLV